MAKKYDGCLIYGSRLWAWAVRAEENGVKKIYLPLFRTKEEARQYVRSSSFPWEIVKIKLVEVE